MKKIFKLSGLDCANCSAKIEAGIQKLDGVTNASVNFMTTRLIIEGDDGKMDAIVDAARAIVKKFEPDVVMQKA